MNTKLLFGALAAFSMLTACSSDEPAVHEQNGGGTESYVSFSIASSNVAGNKAAGSRAKSDDSNAEFENGTPSEEKIDNVVLFFYDQEGNAINVNMGSINTNYKVIKNPKLTQNSEPVGSGDTPDYNVENWFKETIEITTATTISEARVLAIVNANIKDGLVCNKNDTPLSGSLPMSVLYGSVFGGYYSTAETLVMSTSVYVDNSRTVSDVPITIYEKEEDATNNPTVIYVERVRARACVIDGQNDKGLYTLTLQSDVDVPTGVTKENLKIKVLGWDLNTTANNAYLFKQLNSNVKFDFIWNDPTLHRSYWETPINLTSTSGFTSSFKHNEITTAPSNTTFKYCNPNTTTTPTKVLVCTQLVDATTDKPVEIASWYGNTYTIEDLKTAILAASPKKVYVKTGEGDGNNAYTNVTKKYVDFNQGSGTGKTEYDRSWMAYAKLKSKLNDTDPEEIKYYKEETREILGEIETIMTEITTTEAMQLIGFTDATGNPILQGAKIWKDGYAYYFVDINHLGDKKAMVRNHSYTIRIDGFEGLGTPVFDPDKVIPEPTLPDDDKQSYISVTMNVLSWRIIPVQSVTFGKEEEKK